MVTFLKLEVEEFTDERLSKLNKYYKLDLVGIDEDLLVFRINK